MSTRSFWPLFAEQRYGRKFQVLLSNASAPIFCNLNERLTGKERRKGREKYFAKVLHFFTFFFPEQHKQWRARLVLLSGWQTGQVVMTMNLWRSDAKTDSRWMVLIPSPWPLQMCRVPAQSPGLLMLSTGYAFCLWVWDAADRETYQPGRE